MTLPVGIHDQIAASEYHADPAERPSLSASVADLLLRRTPYHAWQAHPRLNLNHEPDHDLKFNLGTALHTALLGGESIVLVAAETYHTKAAKTARDAAHEAGKTPLLAPQYEAVMAAVEAVRKQIGAHRDLGLHGKAEQTIIWDEEGVLCRCRPDWLQQSEPDLVPDSIIDLKFTATSPHGWEKHAWNMGYDLRAGFYRRALHTLLGTEVDYKFLNVESKPPHRIFVTGLTPGAMELADAKAARAISRWRRCLETDSWPAWRTETYYYDPPPWEVAAWEQEDFTPAANYDPATMEALYGDS